MASVNTTSLLYSNTTDPPVNFGGCMPPRVPPEENIYQKTSFYLWLIVPPIVTIIGVFGNILTMLILLRQFGRWSSTAVFLFILALSDIVQLLNSPVRNWIINGLKGQDVRHLSELGCKFSKFITYASVQFSSWILVAVTVERFISVQWPHRVREGCTPKSSTVVIIVLLLTIVGLNAHIFYGHGVSDLQQFGGLAFCEVLTEEYLEFWYNIWPWIDFAVAFAVPFLVLVLCNALIIYRLHKTQTKIRRLSIIESSREKAYAKDKRNVTITLVLLSVAFMICLTPVQVYFIVLPYRREAIGALFCVDFEEFFEQVTINDCIYTIVNVVSYINAAFNFILYVLSGNKFRNEFKALLLCRKSGRAGVFGNSSASKSSSSRRRTKTTENSRDDSQNSGNFHRKGSYRSGIENKGFSRDPSQSKDSSTLQGTDKQKNDTQKKNENDARAGHCVKSELNQNSKTDVCDIHLKF